jgi:hypothetical protein
MKSQALVTFGAMLAIAGAAAACTAKVEQKAPSTEQPVAEELKTQRGRHLHGPVKVVIEATRAVGNLTPEQAETLDTIQSELLADSENRKALHERLRTSAVAVVRAGTTNGAEFDRSVGEAVKALEERMTKHADALEEIHGMLTPEQRSDVADALRIRIDEKFGKKRDEKRHAKTFQRFASHLVLSKLQIEQLTTIKKELIGEKRELRPSREELTTLVDAFEGEDFRTALNDLREKKTKILRSKVADAGKRTDSVLSVFTREQRELLADLILEGPAKVLLQKDEATQ